MITIIFRFIIGIVRAAMMDRAYLVIENTALRQQLVILKDKRPRPNLRPADRVFWTALRKTWSRWANSLIIVKPSTVVRWHRMGFRLYWRWKSRSRRIGRPKVPAEIRKLIRNIAFENVTWGAPRVHAELLKLGFSVNERTVSRYMPKRRPTPDSLQRWITFLRNHRDCLAGMDFFTVPSATLELLYVFFVVHHARRKILHFAVTVEPYALWIVQQLREAFPEDNAPRYLIFDRDGKYGKVVPAALKTMGVKIVRTAYRSPWQNPFAERFVGSVRRELLDHVVVLNEAHLQRHLSDCIAYYHEDRCHLGLDKDTPSGRPATPKPSSYAPVVALPRVGGLHHRYGVASSSLSTSQHLDDKDSPCFIAWQVDTQWPRSLLSNDNGAPPYSYFYTRCRSKIAIHDARAVIPWAGPVTPMKPGIAFYRRTPCFRKLADNAWSSPRRVR
ncbi:MAG: integrase core domain-containing protein [Pseudomonadota bacterium]